MLRGATFSAEEIAGTAVLRMVVSSDSMKKATATSHGRSRLEASEGGPVLIARIRAAGSQGAGTLPTAQVARVGGSSRSYSFFTTA